MGTTVRTTAVRAVGMVAVLGLAGACSGEQRVMVGDRRAQLGLADEATYATGEVAVGRVTPSGIRLSISAQYFEPLRVGDWVAADECSFNTTLSVGVGGRDRVVSEPFDGPRSQDDAVSGWLGAVVEVPLSELTTTTSVEVVAPLDGEVTTTGGGPDDEVVPATSVVPSTPPTTSLPTSAAPPATTSTAASTDTSTVLDPTTTAVPELAPTTSPDGATGSLRVLVVAVFGHRSVATLSVVGADSADPAAVDTQPLDGWAVLAVSVPAGGEAPVPAVTLELRDEAGVITTADLDLGDPAARGSLMVGTPAWRFDPARVTEDCRPPEGSGDNTTTTTPRDLLDQPIGSLPALPAPGEPPASPTDATAAALAAIRTMYDMSDPLDEAKAAVGEDPEVTAQIIGQLRRKKILEPYLADLDPTFGPLVFTSPSAASVLYRVGPSYQWEVGRVLLVDGTWRVAVGTICRDLADAAYTCPSSVVPDPPPGPLGGQRIPGG